MLSGLVDLGNRKRIEDHDGAEVVGQGEERPGRARSARRARTGAAVRAAEAARAELVRSQIIAAAGTAGFLLLIILLLLPRRTAAAEEITAQPAATGIRPTLDLDIRPPEQPQEARTREVSAPPTPAPPLAPPAPAQPVAASAVPLEDLARICIELAKLEDGATVPAILDRTASALGASGLVVWVVDAERRELKPIAAHGYAPSVLSRMGSLPVDSENVTAAAFRTGLVQTVAAREHQKGALAAPLPAPGGCLGVVSAEMRNGGEKDAARLAAASIVAAQLATVVGPPADEASHVRSAT